MGWQWLAMAGNGLAMGIGKLLTGWHKHHTHHTTPSTLFSATRTTPHQARCSDGAPTHARGAALPRQKNPLDQLGLAQCTRAQAPTARPAQVWLAPLPMHVWRTGSGVHLCRPSARADRDGRRPAPQAHERAPGVWLQVGGQERPHVRAPELRVPPGQDAVHKHVQGVQRRLRLRQRRRRRAATTAACVPRRLLRARVRVRVRPTESHVPMDLRSKVASCAACMCTRWCGDRQSAIRMSQNFVSPLMPPDALHRPSKCSRVWSIERAANGITKVAQTNSPRTKAACTSGCVASSRFMSETHCSIQRA